MIDSRTWLGLWAQRGKSSATVSLFRGDSTSWRSRRTARAWRRRRPSISPSRCRPRSFWPQGPYRHPCEVDFYSRVVSWARVPLHLPHWLSDCFLAVDRLSAEAVQKHLIHPNSGGIRTIAEV